MWWKVFISISWVWKFKGLLFAYSHWFLQLYMLAFYKNMTVSGGVFLIKVLLKKFVSFCDKKVSGVDVAGLVTIFDCPKKFKKDSRFCNVAQCVHPLKWAVLMLLATRRKLHFTLRVDRRRRIGNEWRTY